MRTCLFALLLTVTGCSGELQPINSGDNGGGADGGASAGMFFRPGIQQDLDTAGCTSTGCHGGTSVPMPLAASPSSEDDWRSNYDQVKARAGGSTSSLLVDKATGAGGHVSSMTESEPMIARWRSWIASGSPYEYTTSGVDAGTGAGADAQTGDGADAGPAALTWVKDINPLFQANGCRNCHGTAGAYSVETYSAALGFGTDQIPNVIPGDATSILITYCTDGHEGIRFADALKVVEWIVDANAAEQ